MRFWRRNKHYLLLLPGFVFVLLFTACGIGHVLLVSLWDDAWSLAHYQSLLHNSLFMGSLLISLRITVIVTVLSLGLGLLVTRVLFYYLRDLKWRVLIWIPMLVPHFVAAYLVFILFSQTGLVSSLLYQLHLIEDYSSFPILVNDRGGIGIILAYTWKSVPFVVLMVLPVYYQLNRNYLDVVKTLGGGRWEMFKDVEWPAVCPVLLETGMILFSFVIAAFEIPSLLGATYPKLIPALSYDWFTGSDWDKRPLAMAVMVMVTAVILILVQALFLILRQSRYNTMRGR